MAISSVSGNSQLLSTLSSKAEVSTDSNTRKYPDIVNISNQGKSLLLESTDKTEEKGQESLQVSSSTGRFSRMTGLQKDEIAALYRSIENLT